MAVNDLFDDISYTKPQYPPLYPNAKITLYLNIPWDGSYSDVMWFEDAQKREAFFQNSGGVLTLEDQSEIEIGKPIRLNLLGDKAYQYNYCKLESSSLNTLYCFITKIEHVNMHSCLMHYTIDIFQTWRFFMRVHPCYVEREHVNADYLGKNTMEENLPCGEYKRKLVKRTNISQAENAAVLISIEGNEEDRKGGLHGGIYSGLKTKVFPTEGKANVPNLGEFIEEYVNEGKTDKIVAIQMIPYDFYSEYYDQTAVSQEIQLSLEISEIDGYSPKNLKSLQYPYNYLEVDNTQGEIEIYNLEYFKVPGKPSFVMYGNAAADSPEILLIPKNYSGLELDITSHMSLSGFPMCAWNGDAYKAYLANNSMKNAVNLGSSVLSGASSVVGGLGDIITGKIGSGLSNIAGAAGNMLQTVGNLSQESHNATIAGNKMRGTRSSNVMYGAHLMEFWFYNRHVDRSHIEFIDSYFSRYGYRIGQIKLPNITGRTNFNYVQTRGSCVTGSIPAEDLAIINSVFNRGVTFWHNMDAFGDYSVNNPSQ